MCLKETQKCVLKKLKEIGYENLDWIRMCQCIDHLHIDLKTVIKLMIP
jgi:hypothetical protein